MQRAIALFVMASACSTPPSVAHPPRTDCDGCPPMVVVPGGTFLIGSPDSEPGHHKNETPQREVRLASFAIGETEVTVAQYARFVDATHRPSDGGCLNENPTFDGTYALVPRASWHEPGFAQTGEHPVVCVSWQDAADYAAWLSRITGSHYHLPSEAEWEYAARAGTRSAYPWGADRELGCVAANGADRSLQRALPPYFPAVYASCDDGFVYTAPARHYRPNGFGLYGTSGNVWEWVDDCYAASYDTLAPDGRSRSEASCEQRVDRGGSWDDDPQDLRSASRHHIPPATRAYDLGFRIARTLP